LNRRLGGPQSWSGCYRKEKKLLPFQELNSNSSFVQKVYKFIEPIHKAFRGEKIHKPVLLLQIPDQQIFVLMMLKK
jgi:hypothetical protein